MGIGNNKLQQPQQQPQQQQQQQQKQTNQKTNDAPKKLTHNSKRIQLIVTLILSPYCVEI